MIRTVIIALTCFSLFLSIVFLDALLDPPGYIGKLQGESTATSYLEHVINGEEEQAFDYVYYFDGFIDEEVNISHEKAKQIWVDRVQQLRQKGTYIKEYKKLSVNAHDGWVQGYVTLTIMNNGIREEHEVYIAFQRKEGAWKVAGLQSLRNLTENQRTVNQDWEALVSGKVD